MKSTLLTMAWYTTHILVLSSIKFTIYKQPEIYSFAFFFLRITVSLNSEAYEYNPKKFLFKMEKVFFKKIIILMVK